MQINEIFSSIEGEGIRAGYLATFIRTQFCNLKCTYCDTKYSWDTKDDKGCLQYRDMTVGEIINKCKNLGNKRITFTGGEPLLQLDSKVLLLNLLKEGYEVNIETNGSININDYTYIPNTDLSNLIITMDWKSPSSGAREEMLLSNLMYLRGHDVLKFVVGNKEDLDDMREVVNSLPRACNIFVSPVFGEIEPKDIVEYLKENNLQNIRMQLQLHKFIWPVEMRGV